MTDSRTSWFAACLRFVIYVADAPTRAMESVYIFTAADGDFDAALRIALDLGRRAEEQYRNADGEEVCWRFARVVTLDTIRRDLDGAEVYSAPLDLDEADHGTLDPENTPHGMSGI